MLVPDSKILITGARGMVGSALVRIFGENGYESLLTPSRSELDLLSQRDTAEYLAANKPDVVIIAAAKVGGIHANATYPADFIYENLAIASNLVHGSYQAGVPRLLFLGSSCIYPKLAPQPLTEESLLTSALEPSNEAYAIAKIAGLKLCEAYRKQHGMLYHSAMPTNLYGQGDNYHPENSHVIPGLIRRFHEAKESNADKVTIWGTGKPRREFLYVDELAEACHHLLRQESPPNLINIGYGEDVTIAELAQQVSETVGYEGVIDYDTSKLDGTPQKLMDVTKMKNLGWQAKIGLSEGLKRAYAHFISELESQTVRSA